MTYYKGCLKKEDFNKVRAAMRTISIAIMVPEIGGFTENGQDYYTVDFIVEPQDLKEAVDVMKEFINAKGENHAR